MEVLLAAATSAIVLAAIGSVFYSGMRLRDRTNASIESALPLYHALDYLRRDFRGALPPGGTVSGDFISTLSGSGVGLSCVVQFSTTTGQLTSTSPWGDVQEVIYQLRPPTQRTDGRGMDLVRSVTRNLLTSGTLEAEEQLMLEKVEAFEVACFDGYDWQTTWDTSLRETNLPTAVRIRITMEPDQDLDRREWEPVELVIPLVTKTWNATGLDQAEQQEAQQ